MNVLMTRIHKWLAVLMAIQILFWFGSGLIFAIFPIERVRSEHVIARSEAPPIPLGVAADGLLRLGSAGVQADRVEIRNLLGQPVALLHQGEESRLYDLADGERLSPLPAALATEIAEADHLGPHRAIRTERVTEAGTEYRGALPAWRVDFADGANRSIYVAADTGLVTARRSDLWRFYDFLWGLHIMDWRGHEDFNSPVLIISTLLALILLLSGIWMLMDRFGLLRRRRRKPPEAPPMQ